MSHEFTQKDNANSEGITYSYVPYHHRISHVHFSLVRGPFVRFAAEKLEIFTPMSILEFFDVGIIAEIR